MDNDADLTFPFHVAEADKSAMRNWWLDNHMTPYHEKVEEGAKLFGLDKGTFLMVAQPKGELTPTMAKWRRSMEILKIEGYAEGEFPDYHIKTGSNGRPLADFYEAWMSDPNLREFSDEIMALVRKFRSEKDILP